MLQTLLNECVLDLELTVAGRLLVKEPPEQTEKRPPRPPENIHIAQPVCTPRPDGTSSIYLPGASLKGVLRAQAERIARSLNTHNAGACDPFAVVRRDGNVPFDLACSERIVARQRYHRRLQQQMPPGRELAIPDQYRDVCPICRTFGHLGWGRRLRISDSYPVARSGAVEMTHVGIDRATGGVSTPYEGHNNYGTGRTFTLQYAYRAHLQGQILLENFELWQLGLLGFLWRDMADGLVPVGHKQTTGTGDMRPRLIEMRLTRLGAAVPVLGRLYGVGALCDRVKAYGYDPTGDVLDLPGLKWQRPAGEVRWETRLDEVQALQLWTALAPMTAAVLREHRWPEAMEPARIARLSAQEVVP